MIKLQVKLIKIKNNKQCKNRMYGIIWKKHKIYV